MGQASVKSHNLAVLRSLEIGDIIRFPRGVYDHFATYIGGENVVHCVKNKDGQVFVQQDNFFKVCENSKAEKCNHLDNECRPLRKTEIVHCAKSMIGEEVPDYNLLSKNCEHFATFWRHGISYSRQAETFIGLIISIIIVAIIVVIITAFIRVFLRGRSEKEKENWSLERPGLPPSLYLNYH